jgi:HK97 family phage major capsid protein
MNRLQEIEARLAAIRKELEGEGADVAKLEAETDTLIAERQTLMDNAEKRKKLLGKIAGGQVGNNVPGASELLRPPSNQRKAPDEEEMEYRKAFQAFVCKGTPIPMELRDDESTLTTDITTALPTILQNRIIETAESLGMILPLVTRTYFAAGIKIPTSSVKPVATWVGEGEGSDRQKKTTSAISFTNFKLRCEISMSVESATMALSAFEAAFVRQVSEAMVKAIEAKIISTADGASSCKGILAETPPTGQALTASALTFEKLVEAEAALPQAYEGGAVWCMTKKTFMGFIGMTDAEGQPIARINYGIGGRPERTLLGRTVTLCGDYMDSFSTSLTNGKIFAFLFNFSDYVLNTIYDLGVQRKQDWDTEDLLTKAVMSVDGKVVDKNSLVTIAKA